MTNQELTEIESALAQYRSALREVGNTANLQAATEEVLVVATGLVAEVRRLNGLIERSRRVFTWEKARSYMVLRNDETACVYGGSVDYACGLWWAERRAFGTPEEARAWVETRLRDSGIIKPIDVVEVAK